MEPVRFALVGCGKVAEKHLDALELLGDRGSNGSPRAGLVAVCDLDPRRARERGEKAGVPFYTDPERMLAERPEIEVVTILVPSGLHSEVVVRLAPFGRHFVVEKPMALRVEDCDAMLAACQNSGSRMWIVYQNRMSPAILAARRAMDEGRLGKMVLGTVRVRWSRRQEHYEPGSWRGTWALDGGVIAQQASHFLDLLSWFLGPAASIHCQTATRLLAIEVEDTAVASVRFQSGALGVFEATVAARPSDLEGSLSLLGESGSVIIAGFALDEIQVWRFADRPEEAPPAPANAHPGAASRAGRHAEVLRAVADAVRGGPVSNLLVDGLEGRRAVEFLSALYESAALDGARVEPGATAEHTRLGRRESRLISAGALRE